ncbi:cache domain-containing sensor histidine kinase [Paenibacillus cellulositrophicus]|uniref:cache domain-containing sensor histidine kinase n=1 Tax=Paenibacillus cellulositrophicus TaxID=562959 RepID=UPI003F806EA7
MKNKLPASNQITIKRKLIALIGGQLLLFVLVLYGVFFWFQHILESKVAALAEQTLSTVTGNVEIHLNQQISLSNAIASDSSLIKLLRTHPNFADTSSVWAQVQLIQKMKSYSAGNSNQYSVAIYNLNSGRVLSTTEGSVVATEQMNAWAARWDQESAPIGFYVDRDGQQPLLAGGGPMLTLIRKIPGKQQDNFLMVNTSKQVLSQMIGEVELWRGTGIVIFDENGQKLFSTGGTVLFPNQASALNRLRTDRAAAYQTMEVDGRTYIAVRQHSGLTGWDMAMMIPQKEIMLDVALMKRSATVIFIVIGLVILGLSILLYTQIFNPIKKLIKSMVLVEKGLTYQPLEIKRYDELGFLQKRFNDMIRNEQQMREQIMQEQLHKKEIELKFLQSQVNPHFLYNTLDSIYWVAVENDAEEIGDVVLDLSRYFRLSLSRGKEFVSIREAVEHLEYYVRIQQFRHTGKFEAYWEVDPELSGYRIMKLMLQPIVENAIVHGMERKPGVCSLKVGIKRKNQRIEFRVQDSGAGMDRADLRNLLREIKRQEGPSEATYGLRNLYQRLKLMYGEDMHFAMSSIPDTGTRVTISIHVTRLKEGQ